jgi:hypothetical protein
MKVTKKNEMSKLLFTTVILGLMSGGVLAHEQQYDNTKEPHEAPHTAEPPTGGHKNLSQAATNPIANLAQVQVLNAYNWENHNASGYSNSTILQPVIPLELPWEDVPVLITRTTLPYVATPQFDDPVGRQHGFGDTTLLLLAIPKLETKGIQMGFGVNTVIPTAGDNEFTGSGKWQAGPSFLYINMQTPTIQWGLFTYQLWDFADGSSGSNRDDVSQLALQPFITKHFDKGWYVSTPDVPQIYNFESDKWTWSLGPQVGRVTKIGNQAVKLLGEVFYNPEDDNGPTAEWTAKLGMTFLFPE